MVRRDDDSPKEMTPARLFRSAAYAYVFVQVVGLFILATCDAQHDSYYFRWFALALIYGSAFLVVSTYLAVRRAWSEQPPSDFRDAILPGALILASGSLIWSGSHWLAQ
jgi:positive regulator of sigma E activity